MVMWTNRGGLMKTIIIAVCLVLVTTMAMADVTAEIIDYDLDNKGNIRVWTQYKIDGVEVESQYPKKQGKFVYATRFAAHNLAGMTDEQIGKYILYQSELHCNTLIKKEFIKKTISTNDEIFKKHLKNIKGKTVSKDTTEIRINGNTKMKVKTDGTYTENITFITP